MSERDFDADLIEALDRQNWGGVQSSLFRLTQSQADRLRTILSPRGEQTEAAALPSISHDGPHKPGPHRIWLARQLLDSRLTDSEAYANVAHSPAITDAGAEAPSVVLGLSANDIANIIERRADCDETGLLNASHIAHEIYLAILAALSPQALGEGFSALRASPSVPTERSDGLVLVPREPTEAMLAAAAKSDWLYSDDAALTIYRAMIAATQQATGEGDVPRDEQGRTAYDIIRDANHASAMMRAGIKDRSREPLLGPPADMTVSRVLLAERPDFTPEVADLLAVKINDALSTQQAVSPAEGAAPVSLPAREEVEKIIGDAILEAAMLGLGAGNSIPERVDAGLKAALLRDPAVDAILSLIKGDGRE